MTLEDLKEVLLENEVTNFDPVAEAFKVSLSSPRGGTLYRANRVHMKAGYLR